MTTTDLDLDAGIRNCAGNAPIVALLLADELVGNCHMTSDVRRIAEVYLTEGAVAGRAILKQEAACLDGSFALEVEPSRMDSYVKTLDAFLSEKAALFASVSQHVSMNV